MFLMEFPITGQLRVPLLIMEWIFVITGIEISFIFLFRYFKQEKALRNYQDLGYFSFFFSFSLMVFFFIISDYYVSEKIVSPFLMWKQGSERYLFLNFGYLTIIIGIFFLFLFIERYNIILFRRYVYTYAFFVCAILFVVLFLIDVRMTQSITYIYSMGFTSFFIIYSIKFIKKLRAKGLLLFSGLGLMLIGFLLTTDIMIEAFGLEVRMIGAGLQLVSIVVFSYFFMILPPFSEFDWQEKLEALFIIDSAGICLFYKIFSKKKNFMNEQLISAALKSINVMLEELAKSEGISKNISVIKRKGENVNIYQGKLVSGVLYTSEELNIPKIILKEFIEKFELLYQNILLNWDGSINIFTPVESIVNDFFVG